MLLNDVKRVKNWIMWRQHSITLQQSNSTFFRQHARFNQLTRLDTTCDRFDFARLLSMGCLARTCLWKKCEQFV